MTPNRPYFLRANYEWLVDNELTPHLVVDATLPNVQVPMQYVQDGTIVLNIAPHAVQGLQMGNDEVSFSARFGGVPQQVFLPMAAVKAIYARENRAGMMFPDDPAYEEEETDAEDTKPTLHSAETSTDTEEAAEPTDKPPKKGGRPALRVVK